MADLKVMQVAADARFEQARHEKAVMEAVVEFGGVLTALGITQISVDQGAPLELQINVLMGGGIALTADPVCVSDVVDVMPTPTPTPTPSGEAEVEYVTGRWTQSEIKCTDDLLDQGKTSKQIAKALGRKPSAVSVFVAGLRKQRGDSKAGGTAAGLSKPAKAKAVKRQLVPGKDLALKPRVPVRNEPEQPSLKGGASDQAELSGTAGDRPYAERSIIAHLDAVGYASGWTAVRDFELVEELCKGANLGVVAIELQVGFDAAKERWKLLNVAIGDLGHQVRLCRILRERAA